MIWFVEPMANESIPAARLPSTAISSSQINPCIPEPLSDAEKTRLRNCKLGAAVNVIQWGSSTCSRIS